MLTKLTNKNIVLDSVKELLEKLDQNPKRNLFNKNKLAIPLHLQSFIILLVEMMSMAIR